MNNMMSKKKCDRCGKNLSISTMSKLNTNIICMDCSEKEKTHPKYKLAVEAEIKAVKSGNMNYKGLLEE